MVAMELGRDGGRSAGRTLRWVVTTLWAEGLGQPVGDALHGAVRRSVPGAREALRDFDDRGPRSEIFRAVVLRLAEDLEQEVERSYRAALN
jgi:predicted HAD superfamily phosphohydrolase